jgi:hypothetical protein
METSATIKLFLPRGDAKSLRTAEISNWTGKGFAAPRTELEELLAREELDKPESDDSTVKAGRRNLHRKRYLIDVQPDGQVIHDTRTALTVTTGNPGFETTSRKSESANSRALEAVMLLIKLAASFAASIRGVGHNGAGLVRNNFAAAAPKMSVR